MDITDHKANPVLVEFHHGNVVECKYRGAAIVLNEEGNIIETWGDVMANTCIRSALKPLQAISLMTSGAADYYGLSEKEIALACASHSGEKQHVDVVKAWLKKIGADEAALACGHDLSSIKQDDNASYLKASKVEHGCSGKHMGFLTMARYLNEPLDGYCHFSHPVQKLILTQITTLMNVEISEFAYNQDLCGAMNFHASLLNYACAFSEMLRQPKTSPVGKARERLFKAISSYPQLIAGQNRFCSILAEKSKGNVIGKMGAEGSYVLFIRDQKKVVLLKIDDGSDRAAEVVALKLLEKFKGLSVQEFNEVTQMSSPIVKSGTGENIGEYCAVNI